MATTTTVIKQVESNNSIYNVNDRVRVMEVKKTDNTLPNNEYLGYINDITENSILLNVDNDLKEISVNDIYKMRMATETENFYNTFEF